MILLKKKEKETMMKKVKKKTRYHNYITINIAIQYKKI